VAVRRLTGAAAVAAGGSHSLALRDDGTVRAWGDNVLGQLGDGTATDRYSPVAVQGLTGAAAVAAGGVHSLALRDDGTVRAWGYNFDGELGDGTTTDRYSPVAVRRLTGAAAVAAGGSHSLALQGGGPGSPASKDDCKKGGWREYGFRNQGQCVASVVRGGRPPGRHNT
jgi:alpha-tubulin suppressor-like RCC1 family protein